MGGLLIDTLVYNYLTQTEYYDSKSYLYYDWLSRDFFKYLSELPKQNEYAAPGSRQRVRVKKSFQGKAKQAYDLCLKAIEAENKEKVNEKWKRVYGRPFPVPVTIKEQVTDQSYISWDNTEEFIEDRFPVDIKGSINIDCEVSQNGFRDFLLRHMLSRRIPLRAKKTLYFKVIENTIDEPYQIYWKVLNRGEVARKRNCIRGRIEKDKGQGKKKETTDFRGKHVVECYCVKDGVVVARDSILVPIVTGGTYDE